MNLKELIDEGPVTGLQITVIMVCFILTMLDGFDVLAISFTAPSISDEWDIKAGTLGIVFSAGLVGMMLGAMFIAPLFDIFGRRIMVLISLTVISIAMFFTGTVTSVWQLMVFRLIAGLGIGSMLAGLTSMAAEYSPVRQRNLAITFVSAGYPVGATLGGIITAWIIPEYGWRTVFYAGGILTAAMIPIVLLFLPESLYFLIDKQPRRALQRMNKILLKLKQPELQEIPAVNTSEKQARATVKSLLTTDRRSSTILLWLSFFMCFMTLYFLLSWIPKIVVDAGLPLEKGIYTSVAFNLGAIIGVVLLGYLSDKKGLRPLIFWFLVIGAVLMLAYGIAPTIVAILLVLYFLLGFFVDGGFAGLYAVAARIYPTEIRTTGIGWAIGAGRTGAIAGPVIGGLLIGMGLPIAITFMIFSVPLIIAAFATYAIKSPELIVVHDSTST